MTLSADGQLDPTLIAQLFQLVTEREAAIRVRDEARYRKLMFDPSGGHYQGSPLDDFRWPPTITTEIEAIQPSDIYPDWAAAVPKPGILDVFLRQEGVPESERYVVLSVVQLPASDDANERGYGRWRLIGQTFWEPADPPQEEAPDRL